MTVNKNSRMANTDFHGNNFLLKRLKWVVKDQLQKFRLNISRCTSCHLRYHGRWIVTKKMEKIIFCCSNWEDWDKYFAKKWEKKLFTFQDRREKLFLNLINPRRCIDKFLSSPIKIHRQLSRVNWFQLNERDVHATDANCSWSVVFIAS